MAVNENLVLNFNITMSTEHENGIAFFFILVSVIALGLSKWNVTE